ncbi:MAG: SBBP repeat-containing protein, partial [Planctomycetes bacterium]|nr:SBBP repeat-containing protein [Planctomycetota bacterium]
NGGTDDAFVAKVNAAGTGLVYCGYLGGGSYDAGTGIAVDAVGNAYVTGPTQSPEPSFPAAIGPDLTYNGSWDAFVAKVSSDGRSLLYCGYIGGLDREYGNGIAVDPAGNAYVTGPTESPEPSFPAAVGPDLTYNGATDAFIAKVNAAGTGLVYCGYLGGSSYDAGTGIAVDDAGNAYVTGSTDSPEPSFPVVVGPDLTHNGNRDAFVARVTVALLGAAGIPNPGGQVNLALHASGDAGLPYQIGSSLGSGPIPIDTRRIELSPDPLLVFSTSGTAPTIFQTYAGVLDASGRAQAAIHIPNIPALIGIWLYTAFVTLDPQAPSGIRSISNTFAFPITK